METVLRSIIVEDEILSRETLRVLLRKYYGEIIDVAAAVGSAREAKQAIAKYRPDVVFLDINLPDQNAFDFLESLDNCDFAIIFVTAHEKFALHAIKVNPLDYLLKPIHLDDLHNAIAKLLEHNFRTQDPDGSES